MATLRYGNFKMAYDSVRSHKGRSALTMLGIIIGVAAAVLVVCAGQGVKNEIAGRLNGFGRDVMSIQPTGNAPYLTGQDVSIVQKTGGVEEVVPLAHVSGNARGDHMVSDPMVIATTTGFPDMVNQPFMYGGFFDDDTPSVVLGANLARKLYTNTDPSGQTLTWRGQNLVVAGVYSNFNAPPFSLESDFDNSMFVSYDLTQKMSGDSLSVYEILARAGNLAEAAAKVHTNLVLAHGGADDVEVSSALSTADQSDDTIHLITMLVMVAALVALVVGGVGVMNVMLVSVTERMHEIGVRKAIGATNQQIMRQFTAEAFVLSTVGSVVGLILACAGVGLMRLYSSIQAVIVWQVLVVAPVVAIVVGVFFGSIPAVKAAHKDPIDALRGLE